MDYQARARDLQERTTLKRREAEVQALKEDGMTHKEIADELGIAKNTVDEYSRRIKDRIRRSRATIEELGGEDDVNG